ncbi:WS/DGAT/MGAT family acyltransferase [Actinoalloteichus hoggarensis]|uniref:Diacylglycerol O-acyltransferase n=1 Tax=Actinoalloteichus hoggarensis TaxID=1470176 RepID=A0A221WB17_9PSEU|nr:wax ester/triacylglycerol synthase family O-acyltransferase [Actinoalloteichus hoggarensis]ASO22487.1 putative diacylglycerol O-acyltransferase tgs3 [Actinoalloteichus hoggarensis]MBB5923088.1 WS/DGAT/MGAT family acyltransferase [Actinoalloteichus hoggarensis]
MPDRLSALDASFLYLEDPTTPMHVGTVLLFQQSRGARRRAASGGGRGADGRAGGGLEYGRIAALIEQRLPLAPRYRQKVVQVPGRLARPVWVDDPDFDLDYHLRRSALPRPGSDEQLADLVARLMSRPLDHSRPLWEAYVVEGLSGDRVALITKTHNAMVDGIAGFDIGQVILDDAPTVPRIGDELWMPEPEPGPVQLVLDAATEAVRRPGEIVENVRVAAMDVAATLRDVTQAFGGLASAVRTAARPTAQGPLNVSISIQRRYAVTRTRLADYRRIRRAHGGTVNDVILAVIAGALRNWLLSRGEVVTASSTIRAMVPVSVRDPETNPDDAAAREAAPGTEPAAEDVAGPVAGGKVSAYLVELPVGEASATLRLHHVGHAMRAHQESGQSVAAGALVRLSGFAPPTLHALGARAANSFSRRLFNVVVTNVPGPQVPLYAAGTKMVEMFPVVPLAKHQALSIGVGSYDGGVYFGLNGDRNAMFDVDVLAGMIDESLDELLGTV